ncbi:MAG: S-methyl-5-thioribose-1-phosphate isomerase [Bacillota bacterium]|jgi:methylthioribose-1-phosphate isomerase
MVKAITWQDDFLRLIDQTKLPLTTEYIDCRDYQSVAQAIRTMRVRGAPAIGAAAAFGIVLAAKRLLEAQPSVNRPDYLALLQTAASELQATRPTAVNLFWAVKRMLQRLNEVATETPAEITRLLEKEAQSIWAEDIAMNHRIGQFGLSLVPEGARILTHCNAGALATAGYGTALGVIRAAHAAGRRISVWADETRPLLQGARLTAWELLEDGIPVALITDSMAGYLMQQGKVDLVIVGADRIVANGDVANKIGTYTLAVLAQMHGLPFYVAAPWSTVDLSLSSGTEIPIEERSPEEVRMVAGQYIAPPAVPVYNPAFDLTPSRLVTAIITDRGIIGPPYNESLSELADRN